jgi:hypothetical protein
MYINTYVNICTYIHMVMYVPFDGDESDDGDRGRGHDPEERRSVQAEVDLGGRCYKMNPRCSHSRAY